VAHRVLFIDDDPELLEIYRHFFCRSKFIVDCASTRDEAVGLIVKNRYAAIICDLRLNRSEDDRQGFDLARATRLIRPAAAFLLLTACGCPEIDRESREAGVFRVLRKPKSLSAIKDTIMFAIDPARTALAVGQ
jgi:DNA-binding response OmpR family regulator